MTHTANAQQHKKEEKWMRKHRTMMLLCFLAYMLYTTACRFTISRLAFASLIKVDSAF